MANHSPRRPHIPGGQPRKLYPTVTSQQRKSGLAPHMSKLISKNQAAIEADGNRPGVLTRNNTLTQPNATGKYKSDWQKGNAKNTMDYRKKNGGSMKAAKDKLYGAHEIKMSADPRNK